MPGPNKIKPGYGPTGGSPYKVVPCLHDNLPGVVSRVQDEQRHVIVESRHRQITNNPLASKWREETPELDQFYSRVNEDKVNLNRARKKREG